MSRTFVTSDTHGCSIKLQAALDKAEFDYENDKLIHLGDIVDKGPDPRGVVNILLKVKNLIPIQGNHDWAFKEFIETGAHPLGWKGGSMSTRESYLMHDVVVTDESDFGGTYLTVPKAHRELFRNQVLHYTDSENRFFVHGGYDRNTLIEEQGEEEFLWDRSLFKKAMSARNSTVKRIKDINGFKRVFLGHTPTVNWTKKGKTIKKPIYAAQFVNIDTGGCYDGKISLLDITDDDAHILYRA